VYTPTWCGLGCWICGSLIIISVCANRYGICRNNKPTCGYPLRSHVARQWFRRLHILRAPRYDDLTMELASTAVWELLDFRSSLKCRWKRWERRSLSVGLLWWIGCRVSYLSVTHNSRVSLLGSSCFRNLTKCLWPQINKQSVSRNAYAVSGQGSVPLWIILCLLNWSQRQAI